MDEQEKDTNNQSPTPHGAIDWLKYTNASSNSTSWIPADDYDAPAQPTQPAQPTKQPDTLSRPANPALPQNHPLTSHQPAQTPPASSPTTPTFHTAPTLPITPDTPTSPTYHPLTSATTRRNRAILWIALTALILLSLFACLQFNSLVHLALFPLWPIPSYNQNPAYNNNGYTNNNPPPPAVKNLQLAPHTLVIIDGHNSNITVSSNATSTITITARNHNTNLGPDNATNIHYDQSTNAQGITQLHIFSDPAYKDIDYDITAPSTTSLQINTDSGAISVNGISATTIHTTNGGIDLANIQGPVNANTDSGDINAHNLTGTTTLQTTNGSIHLNTITGQLNATTQSGDVIASQVSLSGQSILRTTNGSVRVTATLDPHGTYNLATNSGDVDLTIPSSSAFSLVANTASGSIHNDFNSTTVGTPPRATISISVNNGSININQNP